MFHEGSSPFLSKPVFSMADETTQGADTVTYFFGYHGYDWHNAGRCAQITVDTNRNVVTKVFIESYIR